MNKAKLFLVAAAPAALIVPLEVQATGESVEIISSNGNEFTASVKATQKVESYQWFKVENGVETEIDGATLPTYSVPPASTNMQLVVRVEFEDGTKLDSEKFKIHHVDIEGELRVNSAISAKVNSTPITMKSFQWYYLEDGKKTAISGATDVEFIVPAQAAGKHVFVEAFSEQGDLYVSEAVQIKTLTVKADGIKIKGYSPGKYLVSGDVVTAFDPTIKIYSNEVANGVDTEVDLLSSTLPTASIKRLMNQVTYSYQWLYQVEDGSYAFIEGANTEIYTIPQDAEERNINKIVVRVIATVGETVSEAPTYSPILEIVNSSTTSPVAQLVSKIDDLIKKDVNGMLIYDVTNLDKVDELLKEYNKLTDAAKAKVTNYDVLTRAIDDKVQMTAFAEKVKNAKTEAEFKALLVEYEQFDLLKRSTAVKVDNDKGIFEFIQGELGNDDELTVLKDINTDILGLLKNLTAGNASSSYELVEYNDLDIESLKVEIKSIEDRIMTLPNDYKAIVQNQDILKTAKADIKKVESFLEKLKKIDLGATPKKQVSAAKSVRSAYNKLTIKQLSIVPEKDIEEILLVAENAEKTLAERVQKSIHELIDEATKEYLNPPNETDWKEYVKKVSSAVLQYKGLSKDTAKFVVDYTELLQLQKDLKIAEKVISQIEKYLVLLETENVSYSKQLSAYNSASKALMKLTTLQKSLVYNQSPLPKPSKTPSEDDTELSDAEQLAKEQGTAFITDITTALAFPTDDFELYAKGIDNVVLRYKNELSSPARKYVDNYGELKEAEKDVKAVRSFLKKVEEAEAEADTAKKYTKILTVQKNYLKLPYNQQKLAKTAYQALIALLEDKDKFVDLSDLNGRIGDILPSPSDEDEYTNEDQLYEGTITISDIKALDTEYRKLSSAEKKQITNYTILKTALADVKKVESFEKKYYAASSKTAMIKAFNTLSARQAALVSDDIRNALVGLESDQRNDNDQAIALVEEINDLENNGFYRGDLLGKVNEIQGEYEQLSSTQKSLVKNYAMLTRAKADLAKVSEVKAIYDEVDKIQADLAEQISALSNASGAAELLIKENIAKLEKDSASKEKEWRNAFNRLSNKLEALYKQMYPIKNPKFT